MGVAGGAGRGGGGAGVRVACACARSCGHMSLSGRGRWGAIQYTVHTGELRVMLQRAACVPKRLVCSAVEKQSSVLLTNRIPQPRMLQLPADAAGGWVTSAASRSGTGRPSPQPRTQPHLILRRNRWLQRGTASQKDLGTIRWRHGT